MKASKYNYFVNNGDVTIVFNGISEKFFEVKTKNLSYYQNLIGNSTLYEECCREFVDRLHAEGFIYDEEKLEEFSKVRSKFEKLQRPDQYFLMILPTYQCNLRCWYCVQKHQNLWLSDETTELIKKHIKLQLQNPAIKTFLLSWFGGEPLMAYDKLIEITKFARDIANAYHKEFSVMITTNGTLLTNERIEELRELGVSRYQITIDGKRELHDKVKTLHGSSSYDRTIENINLIAQHTSCCVRFNYTKENLEPQLLIADIKDRLSDGCKENLSFLIYKVWQEDEKEIDVTKVDELFKLSDELGIHPRLPRSGMCYADQKYFNCIFPDGTIEKCDNEDPSTAKGKLMSDGSIEWEGGIPKSHLRPFDMSGSECHSCDHLPLCWGPCVAKRDFLLKNNGKIICIHKDKDEYMGNIIKNIVKNYKSAYLA